jgi:hypothetical protein
MKLTINNRGLRLIFRNGLRLKLDVLLLDLFVISLMISGINCGIKLFNNINTTEVVVVAKAIVSENIILPVEAKTLEPTYLEYRMTSYYTGDSTNSTHRTGSGLTTDDFEINENGWYTYEGKLVVAAATEELLNSNEFGIGNKLHTRLNDRHYFRYYDELTLIIDGLKYEAIVLDSCGASMYVNENRIDLFVSSKKSVIDRGYKGINPIEIEVKW